MKTAIGEFVVGAYLKLILKCDVVDYNVKPPAGGMEGLAEYDVVGLRFSDRQAFICEVSTHLDGLQYGDNQATLKRIKEKIDRQRSYAKSYLANFENTQHMFWSPVVPRGFLTQELPLIADLELKINERYTACIDELRAEARRTTRDVGNAFFRALQILEHLRQ